MFTQKRGSLEYSKERAVLIATKESAAVITQKRLKREGALNTQKRRQF